MDTGYVVRVRMDDLCLTIYFVRFSSFHAKHVESAPGYPRSLDDFTLELRLFVSHSLCCYRASDRWDPMVPRESLIGPLLFSSLHTNPFHIVVLLEFFHKHRKRLTATGVKVLFIESIVPYYENLMRQWCFVCGLLGLFIISVAIRLFIRSRWVCHYIYR